MVLLIVKSTKAVRILILEKKSLINKKDELLSQKADRKNKKQKTKNKDKKTKNKNCEITKHVSIPPPSRQKRMPPNFFSE